MEEHKIAYAVLECTWSVRHEASVIDSSEEQLPSQVSLIVTCQQVPGSR